MVGVVAVGLVACGGGSGTGANSGTATTINGIAVPPAPDVAANNATLAGVDSNGNGVRDDVERKVASDAVNQAQYDARVSVAKEYQTILTTSDSTSQNINRLQKNIACGAVNGNGLIGDNRKIRDLVADNEVRKLEIKIKLANAGGIAVSEETCK